jgi:hypothetical protein
MLAPFPAEMNEAPEGVEAAERSRRILVPQVKLDSTIV